MSSTARITANGKTKPINDQDVSTLLDFGVPFTATFDNKDPEQKTLTRLIEICQRKGGCRIKVKHSSNALLGALAGAGVGLVGGALLAKSTGISTVMLTVGTLSLPATIIVVGAGVVICAIAFGVIGSKCRNVTEITVDYATGTVRLEEVPERA